MFIKIQVVSGNFYKNLLNKCDYFTLIRKDIDYGFKNLSMITSIPQAIFTDSLKDDKVRQLSYSNISSAEGYMKYENNYIDNKIDTSRFLTSLKNYH
jgi:hypothetical protein